MREIIHDAALTTSSNSANTIMLSSNYIKPPPSNSISSASVSSAEDQKISSSSSENGPKFIAHGLTIDEPLEVNEIIKSCYANPDRKKFPFFWTKTKYIPFGSYSLVSAKIYDNPAYFINKVNKDLPRSVKAFNLKQIRLQNLHDVCDFTECLKEGIKVDKNEYLESIKSSKWYGPYKWSWKEYYYFYSISDDGQNSFYSVFGIYFSTDIL